MMDFTATWGWPQWTILVLAAWTMIWKASRHGKPRDNHSGFEGVFDFALLMFILTAGGFFA